ncbi:hypothetical protein HELRODRAFT_171134 [Helobdella robusta]|uniref:Uncharacterized protein n=1 Tax=Helobdella robusta TaxID=6412 RepID=T1F3U3_HELRO|nr:hypothetical protein HELRODRAFT_171134 [Helobdella robusta]ESO05497.1 hypothetical protein HELRODRAFT_171134 [Helobdella robusta]
MSQALFNPVKNEILTVLGSNTYKFYKLQDFRLQVMAEFSSPGASNSSLFREYEPSAYVSLTSNIVYVIDNEQIIQELEVCSLDTDSVDSHERTEDLVVRSIVAVEHGSVLLVIYHTSDHDYDGFWCTCGKDSIHYFERTDSSEDMFVKKRELKVLLNEGPDLEVKRGPETIMGRSPFIIFRIKRAICCVKSF